ncbi:MAG: class I SAM-dependent methyltransferase [Polyangiaceae bacterium]
MPPTDYERLAPNYAQHRSAHPHVLEKLVAAARADSVVLEIGCGTGNYVTEVRRLVGCQCAGIDPAKRMLEVLQARAADVEATLGNAEYLPFADARFDLAYSVDVVHHLRDRQTAFQEMFRVLQGGGRVCTVTDSEDIIRAREPLSTYFPETVEIELGRYPRVAALRDEMTKAGFVALREEQVELIDELTDAAAYRAKAFSSLLQLSEWDFARGLERLESELARGPVRRVSRYLLLWGEKPPI